MTDGQAKPGKSAWRCAISAAAVGAAVHMVLFGMMQFAALADVASTLAFFLVPGRLAVSAIGYFVGPDLYSSLRGSSFAALATVPFNLIIYANFGFLFWWLWGRPRYLYLLPGLAALALWVLQIGLTAGLDHKLETGARWTTITDPRISLEHLEDIVVGSTTRREALRHLGEPTCLLRDADRELLVYRAVRIRGVKARFDENGKFHDLRADSGDRAEEVLHILVVSGGKVSDMMESRTAIAVGDVGFSCDLLRLNNYVMIQITDTISIAEDELEESFIRSPGPGGQNVNKVETAVQLRFDAANSPNLPPEVFARLKVLAGQRMTTEGVVVITARRFRSQERNRQDARERLVELVRRATVVPKKRRPTRPTLAAKRRRIEAKKQRGATKRTRGRVTERD